MEKLAEKTYRIDSLLNRFLYASGLDHKILEVKVLRVWREIVGHPIAQNTRPISLVNGRLTVYTTHNTWMTELSLLRPHIIEGINTAVGQPAVKYLQFFIKPFDPPLPPKSQRFQRPRRLKLETTELTPETLEHINQTVEAVEDTDLRACLKRLFATQSQCHSTDDYRPAHVDIDR